MIPFSSFASFPPFAVRWDEHQNTTKGEKDAKAEKDWLRLRR